MALRLSKITNRRIINAGDQVLKRTRGGINSSISVFIFRDMMDVFADKPDRAVAEQELGAAGMQAAESATIGVDQAASASRQC